MKGKIEQVDTTLRRPFWSVMIPTYNRVKYLEETLRSVLEQCSDYDDMQIEVVDNCSTSTDPEKIVKAIGNNKVSFYRQPNHVDMSSNWNTCIQRSRGHWVHILHDDDIVLPKFYDSFRKHLEKEALVGAAFCRFIFIDEEGRRQALSPLERKTPGIISNFVERIVTNSVIYTPAIVVKRDVYVELGGFNSEAYSAADWEMWKRIAVHYPIWYEPEALACYREDSASMLRSLMLSGRNVADARKAIEITQTYLPENIAVDLSDRAKEHLAFLGLKKAEELLGIGQIDGAIAQTWEGLVCSITPTITNLLISLINSTESVKFVEELIQYGDQHQEEVNSEDILEILRKILSSNLVRKDIYPKFIIDGVFFQLFKTGIARLWKSLLEEWTNNGFAKYLIVLDRGGTAPKIPGIRYRIIPPYDYKDTSGDREMLQQICDEEEASLFISTYYTTPISTPSVFMAYDMIPEVLEWNLNETRWQEKHFAIRHASAYIAISENTARDLIKFFPDISPNLITVAYCGVSSTFNPASATEVSNFRNKYGIAKPYFIFVGLRSGYKNGILFFQAFDKLYSKQGFEIVCSSFDAEFEDEFRAYTSGCTVHKLQLSDIELRAAYAGAVASVFPSQYEGFGLPVLEALACGCPVITCPNASIPEVAGEAALYVNWDDVNGMANALCDVQKLDVRNYLINAGITQAKKFSWQNMANKVSSALVGATLLSLKLRDVNLIIFPDWSQPEEYLYTELASLIKAAGTHPDKICMTLLVDISKAAENPEIDAYLALSSIVMNLLMEESTDVTDGLEISIVEKFGSIQWEALLPSIQGRILLENENQELISELVMTELPTYTIATLQEQRFINQNSGECNID